MKIIENLLNLNWTVFKRSTSKPSNSSGSAAAAFPQRPLTTWLWTDKTRCIRKSELISKFSTFSSSFFSFFNSTELFIDHAEKVYWICLANRICFSKINIKIDQEQGDFGSGIIWRSFIRLIERFCGTVKRVLIKN